MLRRMSVHAAGLREEDGIYICTDLSAPSLDAAIHPDFTRNSRAFEQYAIAGTLHLDHMADMAGADARPTVQRHAILTGMALGISARRRRGQDDRQCSNGILRNGANFWTGWEKTRSSGNGRGRVNERRKTN
jgi:hypothetical protein